MKIIIEHHFAGIPKGRRSDRCFFSDHSKFIYTKWFQNYIDGLNYIRTQQTMAWGVLKTEAANETTGGGLACEMARGTPLKIIRWKDLEIISWILDDI